MPRAVEPVCVAVVLAAFGCSTGEERTGPSPRDRGNAASVGEQNPEITVAPERPGPNQAVRITFPTPYAIGDLPRYGNRLIEDFSDKYEVSFEGPGGRHCRGKRRPFTFGYLPEDRRTRTRTVVIERPERQSPLPRGRGTWCPGRYTGRVEFRHPYAGRPGVEPLGTFSFAVRPPRR